MPQIISNSERQKIESSPTQVIGPHTLPSCVSVAFKSSQPPPVASLTPPPPRHYLRNATSSDKLQCLIQKRSDIYTRAQAAQHEKTDSSWPSAQSPTRAKAKVRPQLLTRSSSAPLATSVNPWKTRITRSTTFKATGIVAGRRTRSPSTKSLTEVYIMEFKSPGAQRREAMVLGLSEVDAHLISFDSGDGAIVAPHSCVHHATFDPNRGELEYKGLLGHTTAPEQRAVE